MAQPTAEQLKLAESNIRKALEDRIERFITIVKKSNYADNDISNWDFVLEFDEWFLGGE